MTRAEFDITATPGGRRARKWPALVLAALMVLVAGLPLAACGKKGDPEPPPGAKDTVYPRPYPDPKSY